MKLYFNKKLNRFSFNPKCFFVPWGFGTRLRSFLHLACKFASGAARSFNNNGTYINKTFY